MSIPIYKELESKTINCLRFPLCVGVVFIHSKMVDIDIQGVSVSFTDYPWLVYIMELFSSILPHLAVPLFFFISGFLFYNNVETFDKKVYKKKLKSRFHSLVIPYLLWNFIGFLVLLIQMHPSLSSLFPLLKDYRIDISEFLSYFWMRDLPADLPSIEHGVPIDGPLWFIRDLIVLIIVTPFIYWLIKKFKIFIVFLLGIVWFFVLGKSSIGLQYMSHQSLFFFPLGAYFSINRISFVELANIIKWPSCILYIGFIIGDLLTIEQPYNGYIHRGGILIGMISIIYIVSVLIRYNKVVDNIFLKDATFFVFAFHGFFVSKFQKLLIILLRPQSPYFVLFIYFFVAISTVLICLGLYKGVNKYAPSVAKIISGGR